MEKEREERGSRRRRRKRDRRRTKRERGEGEKKSEEALRGFLLYVPLRYCRKYGHSQIHVAGSTQSAAPLKEVWEVSTAEV